MNTSGWVRERERKREQNRRAKEPTEKPLCTSSQLWIAEPQLRRFACINKLNGGEQCDSERQAPHNTPQQRHTERERERARKKHSNRHRSEAGKRSKNIQSQQSNGASRDTWIYNVVSSVSFILIACLPTSHFRSLHTVPEWKFPNLFRCIILWPSSMRLLCNTC